MSPARRLPSVALTALVILQAGCRLIPRTTPVSEELTQARRLSNEGLAAADRGELERAESLLDRAVRSCPSDIEARQHYAELLWQRGERVAAMMQIKEALRVAPDDVDLCVVAGGMYLSLGLLDDADRLATTAVSIAPRSARAWQLRAETRLARGMLNDAIGDFHRALAIEPENREILLHTAEAYRQANRPERALATLAILEETYDPDQPPGHVLTLEALAQEALGRHEDALVTYRLAVARGDASPDTLARITALEEGDASVR